MAETNLLLFRSAGQVLALSAEHTRQVVPLEQLYALPGAQGASLGLIAAGGRVLPVVDLPGLLGRGSETPVLALVCELGGESMALPTDYVIGFVSDDARPGPELFSDEVMLGGHFGGGHKGRVLNPQALLAALQSRILSA